MTVDRLTRESIAIEAPGGHLEGIFEYGPAVGCHDGVVVLSPHPRFGGDLWNNVTRGMAEVLANRGYPVVRFNYHGVGESQGPGQGPLENLRYWADLIQSDAHERVVADAIAALDWMLRIVTAVHVVGYSFGAVIALRLAALRPDIRAVVGVGTAIGEYELDCLDRIRAPVLAIHGDGDFATPIEVLEERLGRIPGDPGLVVLDGADHFFRGEERRIGEIAGSFLEDPSARAGLRQHIESVSGGAPKETWSGHANKTAR